MPFPTHAIAREPAVTTVVRSAKQLWPFLAGFGFTGYIMVKIAGTITEDDIKASKFANPKGHH